MKIFTEILKVTLLSFIVSYFSFIVQTKSVTLVLKICYRYIADMLQICNRYVTVIRQQLVVEPSITTRAGLPQFLGWPEVLISFSLTLSHSVPRYYTSCRGVSPTS